MKYPQKEVVCHCAAFPWPHAEFLSRRCWQHTFYDRREEYILSETEQNRQEDYVARWKEMQ